MTSRTWYGLKRPWDQYISQTFGKYVLVDYRDAHTSSVDYPQMYNFVLSEQGTGNVVHIQLKNILDLENWCNQ